jgi:hypothetical protein
MGAREEPPMQTTTDAKIKRLKSHVAELRATLRQDTDAARNDRTLATACVLLAVDAAIDAVEIAANDLEEVAGPEALADLL